MIRMIEEIIVKIIRLVPESTKNHVARWLANEHPLLWQEAKQKAETQTTTKHKKECIICGSIKDVEDNVIQGCCGYSMFYKHDVDMFREAGWSKK